MTNEDSKNSKKRIELEIEVPARETWGNKAMFILSCVGFAVGLGNVWRFPYLCYKNGGGAFLIPYGLAVICGGIPIFILEVAIGQFMSQGGIKVWNICPAFRGIGYASTIVCFGLNVYYNVIIAWTVHYLYNSFTWDPPWASCQNSWNTADCTVGKDNGTIDAATEYWWYRVLKKSSGVHDVNFIQWELALALFIVWILVYFCIWKGIKTSGKVVIFTALFPYVIMTIFFFRAVTLDGATDGMRYFLKPNWSKLSESGVWLDAGTQVFFSYAIAVGCMTALGSYNKFNNDFVKQCISISIVNSGTSLYVGFAIFSVLGFMAKQNGVPIDAVAESGPGLVFIVFPKAISQMHMAPVWSALFFLMILFMGIDSQFVGVEGFITAVTDTVPSLRREGRRKIFALLVCLVKFVIGLLLVTDGGVYFFQLMDYYAASGMVLLWICFWQSVVIAYAVGIEDFWKMLTLMRGPTIAWLKYCWLFFTPVVTLGIMIFMMVSFTRLTYNQTYVYPIWAEGAGMTLALVPMFIIPLVLVYSVLRAPGSSLKKKWSAAISPIYSVDLQNRLKAG